MPASGSPVYLNIPCSSREEAIQVFNNYTHWSIGKFYTVLYKHTSNNRTDVHALVAVGIKNASECGVAGISSEDAWENKYYPNGAKGPEFWRMISDTGADAGTSGGGDSDELYITAVHENGVVYEVANTGGDRIITDPFEVRELVADE